MCFQPKVKTPQPASIAAPEKIYAPAVVSGVQYGGQGDTASGMADATVTPDTETNTQTAPVTTQEAKPAFQQNTTVTTEETAPTKQAQKQLQRKRVGG